MSEAEAKVIDNLREARALLFPSHPPGLSCGAERNTISPGHTPNPLGCPGCQHEWDTALKRIDEALAILERSPRPGLLLQRYLDWYWRTFKKPRT